MEETKKDEIVLDLKKVNSEVEKITSGKKKLEDFYKSALRNQKKAYDAAYARYMFSFATTVMNEVMNSVGIDWDNSELDIDDLYNAHKTALEEIAAGKRSKPAALVKLYFTEKELIVLDGVISVIKSTRSLRAYTKELNSIQRKLDR